MEKYQIRRRDLHMVFIDLQKMYYMVPRDVLWTTFEKKGVYVSYIKAIQDMYNGVINKL